MAALSGFVVGDWELHPARLPAMALVGEVRLSPSQDLLSSVLLAVWPRGHKVRKNAQQALEPLSAQSSPTCLELVC